VSAEPVAAPGTIHSARLLTPEVTRNIRRDDDPTIFGFIQPFEERYAGLARAARTTRMSHGPSFDSRRRVGAR
jgi:hypothetical protein